MTIQVDAIFAGGVLHPKVPVLLPEGAEVRIAIESPTATPVDPLAAVIGIADGPVAGDGADRHDDYIYGKR